MSGPDMSTLLNYDCVLEPSNSTDGGDSANDAQTSYSDITIPQWTEIIGLVEEIENNFLTIICSRTVRIPIGKSVLASKQIKKGSKIGVLTLDEGRVRIRLLDR